MAKKWETLDDDYILLRGVEEDDYFVTQTDLNRWRRKKVPKPRVLVRTEDPYKSLIIEGGVYKFPVNTSPSQKVVRVHKVEVRKNKGEE